MERIRKYILDHKILVLLFLLFIPILVLPLQSFSFSTDGNLVGDNLFDGRWYQSGGVHSYDIAVKPNTTYTISTTEFSVNFANTIIFYDINKQFVTQFVDYNSSTFTVPASCYYLSFNYWRPNQDSYQVILNSKYFMMNEGNVALPFEPYGVWYNSNKYNEALENTNTLDYVFNGARAYLFEDSNNSLQYYYDNIDDSLINDDIVIFNKTDFNMDSFPHIYNYLENERSFDYVILIVPNQDFRTSLYVNTRDDFTMKFNYLSYSNITNIKVTKTINVYEDNYSVIENTDFIKYFSINGYGPDVGGIGTITIVDSMYSFNLGQLQGYNNGYSDGYNDSLDNATINYKKEYDRGYSTGFNDGANTQNTLYNMVIAVAETPVSIFKQIFDFNILGINLSNFIMGIISMIIVVWLVKKLV